MYDTRGELYFDDARKIVPNSNPISTFLLEDFPVSPSQSQEREKDLMI